MSCSVSGCGLDARARGMCDTHYRRLLDGRPLEAPIIHRGLPEGVRFIDGEKHLLTACWCERDDVWVAQRDVYDGYTRPCGRRGCHGRVTA